MACKEVLPVSKGLLKCLPALLAALLLTGCGELSTPELAGRPAPVLGTADVAYRECGARLGPLI